MTADWTVSVHFASWSKFFNEQICHEEKLQSGNRHSFQLKWKHTLCVTMKEC